MNNNFYITNSYKLDFLYYKIAVEISNYKNTFNMNKSKVYRVAIEYYKRYTYDKIKKVNRYLGSPIFVEINVRPLENSNTKSKYVPICTYRVLDAYLNKKCARIINDDSFHYSIAFTSITDFNDYLEKVNFKI